jgi:hypothetical protein
MLSPDNCRHRITAENSNSGNFPSRRPRQERFTDNPVFKEVLFRACCNDACRLRAKTKTYNRSASHATIFLLGGAAESRDRWLWMGGQFLLRLRDQLGEDLWSDGTGTLPEAVKKRPTLQV